MRSHHYELGFRTILVAAAAALCGCSDSPRTGSIDVNAGTGGRVAGSGGAAGSATIGNVDGGGDVTVPPDGAAGGGGGVSESGGAGGSAGAAGSGTVGSSGAAGGVDASGTAGTSGMGGAAGAGGGGAAGAGGAAGGGGAAGTATFLTPPASLGLAVLNGASNYSSTSLSLLDSAGALTNPSCVHTTTTTGGSTTISGDVTLPSQPQRGGKIVLIDRGNTALTFVDPTTCTFDHQISVKGGFNFSNPHDVVILAANKAYVTRYEKNATVTDPTTSGDDVLILDPRDGTIQGHVDLGSYAGTAAGQIVQARPDRALIANGKVVVSLNELSGDFLRYGEGRVVVIDPATNQVLQSVALTGLKNCEAMDYLPTTKLLIVTCGGSFGVQDQVLESGIALVDMSGTSAVLSHSISAVAFNDRPLGFQAISGTISGGEARAFVTTLGAFKSDATPAIPDGFFEVDLGTGVTSQIGTSTAYDLGAGTVAGGRFLLPDAKASMPLIHVYDVTGTPVQTSAFVADTVNPLVPRQVASY